MAEDIRKLEKKLKLKFHNIDLLQEAVVHRSYINEHRSFHLDHNERLEFLGDAILEVVVTEYLFKNYNNPEGELTNWRASLVNSNSLFDVSQKVGLDEFMLLSKGESQDKNTKARETILANAVEAVIGAIYLDLGLEVASYFIHQQIISKLDNILEKKLFIDPKSRFQEMAQEKMGITPHYKVLEEKGPDHAKYFKIGAFIDNDLVASGEGYSKQEAQVQAAQHALKEKGWS